jgi:polyhydroxybutyrate depolymerase
MYPLVLQAVLDGNQAILDCLVGLFGLARVLEFTGSLPTPGEVDQIRGCLPLLTDGTAAGGSTTAPPNTAPPSTAPPEALLPITCPPDEPLQAGLSERTVEVGDRVREYLLYVPLGHDPSEPAPVVFFAHGRGGTAEGAATTKNYGWNALADRDGWFLVYPQAVIPNITNPAMAALAQTGVNNWNIYGGVLDSSYSDHDFFAAVREDLATLTCINPARNYFTGGSGGGYMSTDVACRLAVEFAAVAPVAGILPPMGCPTLVPVPMTGFYGLLDETNPYEGEAGFRPSVDEAMSQWADRNGCGDYSETTIGMTTRLEWDCPSGGETVLYVAADAGHTWPGRQPTPESATEEVISQDISATEVIWEFFARHSRD